MPPPKKNNFLNDELSTSHSVELILVNDVKNIYCVNPYASFQEINIDFLTMIAEFKLTQT